MLQRHKCAGAQKGGEGREQVPETPKCHASIRLHFLAPDGGAMHCLRAHKRLWYHTAVSESCAELLFRPNTYLILQQCGAS